MNKKILISLSVIAVVAGIVSGLTWAYFSNQATVTGNTFSTGNADLQIRLVGSGQGWQDSVTGVNWENLYPGWSESYEIQLRNKSTSPIVLKVIPRVVFTSGSTSMRNVIKMQFKDAHGNGIGLAKTLQEWRDNTFALEALKQGAEGIIWTVEFTFPLSEEDQNHLQGKSLTFDLIFDGIQTEVEEITSDDPMKFSSTGWAGWSCPEYRLVVDGKTDCKATVEGLAWKPGASVGDAKYPTTPFRHTYNAEKNEQGWIVQSLASQSCNIIVTCAK